jgi:hypothetical protein
MGLTTRLALPYPEATDVPNVQPDIRALALAVDTIVATPVISGLWFPAFPYAGTGTQAWGAGLLRMTRTILPNAIQSVQLDISTGASGAVFRVGVWSDTPTGPGSIQSQTADFVGTTTGVYTLGLSAGAGTYWIGVQNVGSVSATLRAATGLNPYLTGLDAPGANNVPNCWGFGTGNGTTLPNNAPTTGITRTGLAALLFLQAV